MNDSGNENHEGAADRRNPPRAAWKKTARLAVIALALVVLGLAAWHWGRPAYERMKLRRLQAEARQSFDQKNYRNAAISARLLLQMNSNNIVACQIMASLAELSRSPLALDWRQKIVQIEPTVANQLALASTALQFQDPPFPLATEILGEITGPATNSLDYHSVATVLALRMNRVPAAEWHLEAAAQLEPTNRSIQLNLAVLRLSATNPAVAAAARGALEQFATDTNFAAVALRSLIAERLLRQDPAGAEAYATQLLAGASAQLGDRLQYLAILKQLNRPELPARLKSLQQSVATNALQACQMAAWMQAGGFSEAVPGWLRQLPADIRSQPMVQLSLAEAYLTATNWMELCRVTTKGDWGELNFLRLALLSRAFVGLGEPLVGDGQWHSAVNLAGNRLGALTVLLNKAAQWGQTRDQADLLNQILQQHPDAVWARRSLEQLYLNAGDTRRLNDLYAGLFARSPENFTLKNNLTATDLLLQTNLSQAEQWAGELYARQPGDPVIASTYAYARHLAGRDQEGLAALAKLPPAQLKQPSVALYYGVLLSATGKSAEAAPYLQIARTQGQLLPEEKKLLEAAMK